MASALHDHDSAAGDTATAAAAAEFARSEHFCGRLDAPAAAEAWLRANRRYHGRLVIYRRAEGGGTKCPSVGDAGGIVWAYCVFDALRGNAALHGRLERDNNTGWRAHVEGDHDYGQPTPWYATLDALCVALYRFYACMAPERVFGAPW